MVERTAEVAHGATAVARLLLGSSCHIRREARKVLTEPMEIKRRRRSMRTRLHNQCTLFLAHMFDAEQSGLSTFDIKHKLLY